MKQPRAVAVAVVAAEVAGPGMAPGPAMVPRPVMVKEVDRGPVAEDTEEAREVVAVAEVAKGEVAALAMGRGAGTVRAQGTELGENMVEAMEEAEVVEVGAAPVAGMDAGVGQDMGPAGGLDTVRVAVPMEEVMEGVAEAAVVKEVVLALVQATDLGLGVVGGMVTLKS